MDTYDIVRILNYLWVLKLDTQTSVKFFNHKIARLKYLFGVYIYQGMFYSARLFEVIQCV